MAASAQIGSLVYLPRSILRCLPRYINVVSSIPGAWISRATRQIATLNLVPLADVIVNQFLPVWATTTSESGCQKWQKVSYKKEEGEKAFWNIWNSKMTTFWNTRFSRTMGTLQVRKRDVVKIVSHNSIKLSHDWDAYCDGLHFPALPWSFLRKELWRGTRT